MRTDKQSEASRINGAKSSGPKTPEGKAKSAHNGSCHNLTGAQIIVLSTENPVEYLEHELAYLERFQPIDGVERDLVRKLIAASWREKRMDVMEAQLIELEIDRQRPEVAARFEMIGGETRQTLAFFGTENITEAFARLHRYQAAARRSYSAAFKALRELQGDRFNDTSSAAPAPSASKPASASEDSKACAGQPQPRVSPGPSSLNYPDAVAILFRRRQPENPKLQTEPERAVPAGRILPLAG
jgi:hypothetical protein